MKLIQPITFDCKHSVGEENLYIMRKDIQSNFEENEPNAFFSPKCEIDGCGKAYTVKDFHKLLNLEPGERPRRRIGIPFGGGRRDRQKIDESLSLEMKLSCCK